MGLKEYWKKRNFKQTVEPKGEKKHPKNKQGLQFVVQKHQASHLHYDFRLEVEGVLKSWAIPKGPSMNPTNKRLAIQVEDHPFEYRTFEGRIPEGNYGAGEVIVWDAGSYELLNTDSPQDENQITKDLEKGVLRFTLHGHKLQGQFTLMRLKGKDRDWLLIKNKDDFASNEDITEQNRSVLSQKTVEELKDDLSIIPSKNYYHKTTSAPTTHSIVTTQKEEHALSLTNLHKIYWPNEGYTKGDLIEYYKQVSPYILPYLKDRPQTLHRYPNGIAAAGFYQKDIDTRHIPSWLRTEQVEHEGRTVDYMIVEDLSSLLYLVNLGCIEINPFNSRIQSLYYPDYLILDLDPENIEFEAVVDTARAAHRLLDRLDIPSVCKTSGSTGLHIYIPMGAQYTYKQTSQFAKLLAHLIHYQLLEITSLERHPNKRQKRVYIDYLQNNFGQTVAAPYCVRPKNGAPVSTPLKWSEVKKGLDPLQFTIKNAIQRFNKMGDIFKLVLGQGIDLNHCLQKIEQGKFVD